jgi:hypothetical protein
MRSQAMEPTKIREDDESKRQVSPCPFPRNHSLLETILEQWKTMSASFTATIRERVQTIEAMPAIPAVLLPLLKMLNNSSEDVTLEEVVRLVSYDNSIAAQCIRVASLPLLAVYLERDKDGHAFEQ